MLTVSPSSIPLLFQAVKEAALAQLAVKVHAGLVIIEVDIVQELLEPLSGHDPQIVIALDPEVVRFSSLRQRLDILRLIDRHGRQRRELAAIVFMSSRVPCVVAAEIT